MLHQSFDQFLIFFELCCGLCFSRHLCTDYGVQISGRLENSTFKPNQCAQMRHESTLILLLITERSHISPETLFSVLLNIARKRRAQLVLHSGNKIRSTVWQRNISRSIQMLVFKVFQTKAVNLFPFGLIVNVTNKSGAPNRATLTDSPVVLVCNMPKCR